MGAVRECAVTDIPEIPLLVLNKSPHTVTGQNKSRKIQLL